MIIKLIDNGCFKKESVIAAKMIRNPQKYFISCENSDLEEKYEHSEDDEDVTQNFEDAEEYFDTTSLLSASDQPKVTNKNKWRLPWRKIEVTKEIKKIIPNSKNKCKMNVESNYSWWTKFYNSFDEDETNNKHKLKIFKNEIELEENFSKFHDWAVPFDLVRETSKRNEKFCVLKCCIKITEHMDQNRLKISNSIQ